MTANNPGRKVIVTRRSSEEDIFQSSAEEVSLHALSNNLRLYRHFLLDLSRDRLIQLKDILLEQNQLMSSQIEEHDLEFYVRSQEWRSDTVRYRALKRKQIVEIGTLLTVKKNDKETNHELTAALQQRDSALKKIENLKKHIQRQESEGDTYLKHFHSIAKAALTEKQYQWIKEEATNRRNEDKARVETQPIDSEVPE